MSVFPACYLCAPCGCYMYIPCTCLVLMGPEVSVIDGCELLDVGAETNLCPVRVAGECSKPLNHLCSPVLDVLRKGNKNNQKKKNKKQPQLDQETINY